MADENSKSSRVTMRRQRGKVAVQSYTVGSVDQFINLVSRIRHEWTASENRHFNPWFRGHRDAAWSLSPGIYRIPGLDDREQQILKSFKRQGALLVLERFPASDWEWYFLMQHYGAPTRLLDWSDGALIALFFAIAPRQPGWPDVDADAAVWMLSPRWLNQEVLGRPDSLAPDEDAATPYLPCSNDGARPEHPAALSPPNIARRLGVQRSRFTIHGNDKDGFLGLAYRRESRLCRIIVKRSAIHRMRIDLTTCGIWDTTIFPDLEGLSREVIRDHTDLWV